MGHYENAFWDSDTFSSRRRDRRSGPYHPYVPDRLMGQEVALSAEAASSCEMAAVALAELDAAARYTNTAESLARILLRSEAVSSSRIEGLEMNARRLLEVEALDELGVSHRSNSAEVEVLGNIQAMNEGVDRVAEKTAITLDDVLSVHAALLEHTRLADLGGVLRTAQNWIGGSWHTPVGSAYVPPRPELVPALMDDMVEFMNGSRLPAVATAAILHAQMETVHPFADGNGRTGRALVHVVFKRAGICTRTVAPVSLVLATMKPQYIEALEGFRTDDANPHERSYDEAVSEWVEFFGAAVEVACTRALQFEDRIAQVHDAWMLKVQPRAKSAAAQLLDLLPGNPVVSIESVARLTGKSYPAARGAVRALEEAGVLRQSSKNRKSGLYVADDVLDEFTRYERAMATVAGDTRLERPVRHRPRG